MNFERLPDWENGLCKYAMSDNQSDLIATLIYDNKLPSQMEIRVTNNKDRFSIPGDKSIMDQMSFVDFGKMTIEHIERWKALKN